MSLLPLFLAVSAATLVSATDHIVGGHLGWNPNINYTLWSNNQTFFLNDLISFRYMKNMYNVFEVNQTGYDNCTLSGVAGNWSSGKDFILLNRTGTYYFICGNGFCLNGMKVSVRVRSLPVNSTSPETTGKTGKHASEAAMVIPSMMMAVLLAIWMGFGEI
ncbi:lamin-like protein [Dioscorea cayenensis subsp. rotundata]|uniref:Lamin-like protein n=1 Tax=Dioscorea cayennensis subsp. rotundata TaxID=55577 RepID=A0AB40CUN2_DIOCR|nr:lamin-like protein [Dioscorea cayenensis subsp. rotundata]